MNADQTVDLEDLVGVKSRVNWGAILGGSVLALAIYFLLTLLGSALGFSISDTTNTKTLVVGGAVYAILVTAASLFYGGYLAAQLTTGENRYEAVLYGLMVWAVVFTMLLWLMATGVRAGFNAMVGMATTGAAVADAAASNVPAQNWEETARRAGFDQKQIEDVKQRAKDAPANAKAAVEDPASREKAAAIARETHDTATKVSWWTFAGSLMSMMAAGIGGYMGAGPNFRLVTVEKRQLARV